MRPFSDPSATLAAAQDLGVAGGAYRLDHLEDALAHSRFADLVVSPHQPERLALDQRILLLFEGRGRLAKTLPPATRHRPSGQSIRGHPVEEDGQRHVDPFGELA